MKYLLKGVAAFSAALCCMLSSCSKDPDFGIDGDASSSYGDNSGRKEHEETRRVLLFYESGFNSLYGYLKDDMDVELVEGYIPTGHRNDDVLLVFSKLAKDGNYEPVESYLRRIYLDNSGKMVSDTLLTYGSDVIANSPATMKDVLTYIKSTFPAKGYGMLLSTHGSGWLPQGYYYSPTNWEKEHSGELKSSSGSSVRQVQTWYGDIPAESLEDDPYAGMVKSIGQEVEGSAYDIIKEMTISEFADAIPFHMDYILFDMCLSAGVEIAYALKDKVDYLAMSPAEVLADGMFDYTTITSYLLQSDPADLETLCKDSFNRYNQRTGSWRSSTITLARLDGFDELSATCKTLFEKYREAIAALNYKNVQGFYRSGRHYFFDLEDALAQCSGISSEDLASLQKAIDGCVVFEGHTPSFLETFDIRTCCGLTTYLPCSGTTLLNKYFLEEPWNKATELLK